MQHNILITGGAGYLGSIMVPTLLQLGHKVTVIDNFMFGQHSLGASCANPDFEVVRGDARNEPLMRSLVKKADVIIPLAALVGAPLCKRDAIGTVSTNQDAVQMLCSILSKDQRILMPITNSGYGIGEKDQFCTEESPLRPISTYGKTKVAAEGFVLERENSISFRLATVFGMAPRMRLDLLVNDFVYRAFNDRFIVIFEGHFRRNFIHIRDVSKAFIHGINNFDAMKGNAFNVGLSEANLTKLELCNRIKDQLPEFTVIEAEVGEDPDKRDYVVSNDKLEATGWLPEHTLEMGIQELIKGYITIVNSKYSNV